MRKTKLSKWERERAAKRGLFRRALIGANSAFKVLFAVDISGIHQWERDYETLAKAHNVIAGVLNRYPRKG